MLAKAASLHLGEICVHCVRRNLKVEVKQLVSVWAESNSQMRVVMNPRIEMTRQATTCGNCRTSLPG